MNRTLLYLLIFIALAAIAFVVIRQRTSTSSADRIYEQFAVKDTARIHTIFIADRNGMSATVKREGQSWYFQATDSSTRYPVRPKALETVMETVHGIRVRMQVPKNSQEAVVKSLSANSRKVMLLDRNGKALKTYYVGEAARGNVDTYMMLEGEDIPYVVFLPKMVGTLKPRYFVGLEDWRDRAIFPQTKASIKSVRVQYPNEFQRSESFFMERHKDGWKLGPAYDDVPPMPAAINEDNIEVWLNGLSSITAEGFGEMKLNRDSLWRTTPFCIITLETEDGGSRKVTFYTAPMVALRPDRGLSPREGMLRYYTFIDQDTTIFVTQHHALQSLFVRYQALLKTDKALAPAQSKQ